MAGYRGNEEVESGSGTLEDGEGRWNVAEGEEDKESERETKIETRSLRLPLAGGGVHGPHSPFRLPKTDLLRQCRRGTGFLQVRLQPASRFSRPPTWQRGPNGDKRASTSRLRKQKRCSDLRRRWLVAVIQWYSESSGVYRRERKRYDTWCWLGRRNWLERPRMCNGSLPFKLLGTVSWTRIYIHIRHGWALNAARWGNSCR